MNTTWQASFTNVQRSSEYSVRGQCVELKIQEHPPKYWHCFQMERKNNQNKTKDRVWLVRCEKKWKQDKSEIDLRNILLRPKTLWMKFLSNHIKTNKSCQKICKANKWPVCTKGRQGCSVKPNKFFVSWSPWRSLSCIRAFLKMDCNIRKWNVSTVWSAEGTSYSCRSMILKGIRTNA